MSQCRSIYLADPRSANISDKFYGLTEEDLSDMTDLQVIEFVANVSGFNPLPWLIEVVGTTVVAWY